MATTADLGILLPPSGQWLVSCVILGEVSPGCCTHDITSATAGANDPKFVNYPLNTPNNNAVLNASWDFHLRSDSPALNKGTTNFDRHFASGITIKGVNYTSPAPAIHIGAFGVK